jgi:hypothetical protein
MPYVGKITDTSNVTGLVGSTLYGKCTTGASTPEKVGTLADFDQLIVGVTIHLKMTNTNTASNPTLNVNSTGAKKIRRYGSTNPGTSAMTTWADGAMISFTYVEETSGSTTTGYWYMNDVAPIKTASINTVTTSGNLTAKTFTSSNVSASKVTLGTATTASKVTLGTAKAASKVTLGTALTASKVTLGTAKSIPNVTANTAVTASRLTNITNVPAIPSATIADGVLTFGTPANAKTFTHADAACSKVTLGTAISVPNVTGSTDVTIPNVTDVTAVSIPNVTAATDVSVPVITVSDVSASKLTDITDVTIPNISVSSTTVVVPM